MPAPIDLTGVPYRPGEVLVKFSGDNPSARAEALSAVGGKLAARFGDDAPGIGHGVERVQLGVGVSVEQAIEILSRKAGVAFVEPDYQVSISAVSNDADVVAGKTWGLYGDGSSPVNAYGSQAAEAWAAGHTGSTKVAVGVIDTGIDYTHPDLYQNIWLNQREIPTALKSSLKDVDADGLITFRDLNNSLNAAYVTDKNANGRIDAGDLLADMRWENGVDEDANGYRDDLIGWDFVNNDNDPMDDKGHGTHVAGTISATGGNGAGVAGVSWSTQLVALKFLDAEGNGYMSNATRATDYFTNASKAGTGVEFAATNNSWGGAGASATLTDAIVRGANAQILFVAAAGNGGSDRIGDNNDATPNYPSNTSTLAAAGYEAVVAVAAITSTGLLASYSNYGAASVDLGAPGHAIWSTTLGGGYGYMSGTSMATPHVSGAIALYAAASPGASAAQVRADLLGATIPTGSLAGKTVTGGRLDASSFLGKLGGGGGDQAGAITGTEGGDLISPTATVSGQPLPGAGADTLIGLGGADTLDGGAGADRLEGGAGSDVYYVDNAGDLVVETLSGSAGGIGDKVIASVSFTLGANVERLALTGAAANGTGNSLDNTLQGNGSANRLTGAAGADVLDGRGGADTLVGGAGADRLIGGTGIDRFVFARGEVAGDTIQDFAAGELIQLTGYSAGSTLTRVAGTTTDWLVTDKATGAAELLHLANGYSLTAGDFLFG